MDLGLSAWMEHAQQGRVVVEAGAGALLVRLDDGARAEAVPSHRMRERGIRVDLGDTVILAATDAGAWQVARRYRFDVEEADWVAVFSGRKAEAE